jgi:hypothetical protein
MLGNLDDLSQAGARLEDDFEHLEAVLEMLAEARGLGAGGKALARALSRAVEFGVDAAITVLEPAAPLIRREIPDLFPRLVGLCAARQREEGAREGGAAVVPGRRLAGAADG